MNMTNLFVELVVIGVGAIIWVGFALLSVTGLDWVSVDQLTSPLWFIPLLSLIYVLGIVTDRMADSTFKACFDTNRQRPGFETLSEYHEARMLVLTGPRSFAEAIEYGRSRIRICRGWAFNGVLIGIFWNLLLWTQVSVLGRIWFSLATTAGLVLMVVGCVLVWRSLRTDECGRIRAQAMYLLRIRADRSARDADLEAGTDELSTFAARTAGLWAPGPWTSRD